MRGHLHHRRRGRIVIAVAFGFLPAAGAFLILSQEHTALASDLTQRRDTLETPVASEPSRHNILFTTTTQLNDGGSPDMSFKFLFPTNGAGADPFTIPNLTASDVAVSCTSCGGTTFSVVDVVEAAEEGADNDSVLVVLNASQDLPAGSAVTLVLGTGATKLTNPADDAAGCTSFAFPSADICKITIQTTESTGNPITAVDQGDVLVAIIAGLPVAASIAETLIFNIDAVSTGGCDTDFGDRLDATTTATLVDFGTIPSSDAFVHGCHDLTISTNAAVGYSVTAEENTSMKTAGGGGAVPTLTYLDGFEHRVVSAISYGTNAGIFDALANATNITIDTSVFRSGAASLKVVENGAAATWARKDFTGTQRLVGSVYFRVASAPSVTSRMLVLMGPGNPARFRIEAPSGAINADWNGIGEQIGPNVADGVWHRLDFDANTSGSTYTLDWQVDDTAQTQATRTGQTATDMTGFRYGSATSTDTLTVWFDDAVLSGTAADYPIGAHEVFQLLPTSDGTHNAGTNVIEDESGNDIGAVTAYNLLDEIPPNTTDYVRQAAVGTGNYAEVNFGDTSESTIWDVAGIAAIFASGTTANNGTARIVDSGGTTIEDIYSGDQSDNALRYQANLLNRPGGGWTQTAVNGAKGRVGFSSNVATVPRWSALFLQYAVPESAGGSGYTIDDTLCDDGASGCTEVEPDDWTSGSNNGFGLSCLNKQGTPCHTYFTSPGQGAGRCGATPCYKQFSCRGTDAECDPGSGQETDRTTVLTGTSPVKAATGRVEYRLSIGILQETGTYSNTITYIATATF